MLLMDNDYYLCKCVKRNCVGVCRGDARIMIDGDGNEGMTPIWMELYLDVCGVISLVL